MTYKPTYKPEFKDSITPVDNIVFKPKQVYIFIARLRDAPQVRIKSLSMTPWISLHSCKEWCEKHCFSYIIKEYTGAEPKVSDRTLYDSDNK